jgi:protein TonB
MTSTQSLEIPRRSLYEMLEQKERRSLRAAIVVALVFHLLIFMIRFPEMVARLVVPTVYRLVNLKPLDQPPRNAGGGPQLAKQLPAASLSTVPRHHPIAVPVPDLTPDQPEPVFQDARITLPDIQFDAPDNLHLGEIYGPPGGSDGGQDGGSGVGRGPGEGPDVCTVAAGITPPEAILKPSPKFTEDAIRNRISGVVLLYGIIRRDGRVDSLRVVRNLGYGLDEEALATVSTQWKFKPATRNGQPVDCYINIEVSFTLY